MASIRIGIPVAVNHDGSWVAHGWNGQPLDSSQWGIIDGDMTGPTNYLMVEAELQLPELRPVEGRAHLSGMLLIGEQANGANDDLPREAVR